MSLSALLVALILLGVVMPALLGVMVRNVNRKEQWCVVDEQGVIKRIGKGACSGNPCYWKRIESYNFTDHPTFNGVRCLEIKLLHKRTIQQFCFRPQEVDEQALNEILRDKLTAKASRGK